MEKKLPETTGDRIKDTEMEKVKGGYHIPKKPHFIYSDRGYVGNCPYCKKSVKIHTSVENGITYHKCDICHKVIRVEE